MQERLAHSQRLPLLQADFSVPSLQVRLHRHQLRPLAAVSSVLNLQDQQPLLPLPQLVGSLAPSLPRRRLLHHRQVVFLEPNPLKPLKQTLLLPRPLADCLVRNPLMLLHPPLLPGGCLEPNPPKLRSRPRLVVCSAPSPPTPLRLRLLHLLRRSGCSERSLQMPLHPRLPAAVFLAQNLPQERHQPRQPLQRSVQTSLCHRFCAARRWMKLLTAGIANSKVRSRSLSARLVRLGSGTRY